MGLQSKPDLLEVRSDGPYVARERGQHRRTDETVFLVPAAPVHVRIVELEEAGEKGRIQRPRREDHRCESEVYGRERRAERHLVVRSHLFRKLQASVDGIGPGNRLKEPLRRLPGPMPSDRKSTRLN